ncbi:MAG TPA: cytochrome c family protein, partial [Nitrospinota bacterium]|nr:cytochrome c family protein [Nitrospinota bacterium]
SSDGLIRFKVKVTNAGAGHYLPTGLTFVRQMWLHVIVKDEKGNIVFESGKVDKKGNIDPEAVIYRSVLGDKDGKPTYFLPGAKIIISDYRISPMGYKKEAYSFPLKKGDRPPLTVNAVLQYRSAPQSLVNSLLGKDAPTIPILDMAEASATIK